jgi:hypothetical protein
METGVVYRTTKHSGSSYEWHAISGKIDGDNTGSSIKVNWGTFDEHISNRAKIIVTETDPSTGCSTDYIMSINVKPVAVVEINGSKFTCKGQIEHYNTNGISENSYYWEAEGGNVIGSNNSTNVAVEWSETGWHNLKLVESSPNGCSVSKEMDILIEKQFNAKVIGPSDVGENSKGVKYSSGTKGHDYKWTVTGGTIEGDRYSSNIEVNWGGVGSGIVQLEETNISGCSSTAIFNVTITDGPVASISGVEEVCAGEAGVVYYTEDHSGSSYEWNIVGGNIIAGDGTNEITVDWGQAGTGTIEVTESYQNGSEASDAMTVTINELPDADITGVEEICVGDATAYETTEQGMINLWSATGGTIVGNNDQATVEVEWDTPGQGYITLEQTDANSGCVAENQIEVTVHDKPVKPEITELAGEILQASEADNYQWYFNGEEMDGETNRTVEYHVTGEFTVKVWNEHGCESEMSDPYDFVTGVNDDIVIANSFAVYPNPANDKLTVNIELSEPQSVEIEIANILGRVFWNGAASLTGSTAVQDIDLSNLPSGNYVVKVIVGEKIYSEMITIMH